MVFTREEEFLRVTRPHYVQQVLKKFELEENDNTVSPASDRFLQKTELTSSELMDVTDYRSKVMSLMFLTRSRIDTKFATQIASTKMQNPTQEDGLRLKRIAQYVNGTQSHGLTFKKSDLQLYASADASYGIHANRKGHSGITISFSRGNGPIVALSRKQSVVAKSTGEAELIALSTAVEAVIPLKGIMEELGIPQNPVKIEQDNASTIVLATRGSGRSEASRSIDVKYFYVTEKLKEKIVKLIKVDTDNIMADGLTKVLNGPKFQKWKKLVTSD
jgi:hypothetical protein